MDFQKSAEYLTEDKKSILKRRKILLITLGAIMLICASIILAGMLIVPENQQAATYGVTDKEKAALVIENRSSDFYILDLKVSGAHEQEFDVLITNGQQRTFEIPPGAYSLSVHYADRPSLDDLPFMTWYVSALKKAEFEVRAGRAARFRLEGGHTSGMMYDPPDLVDVTTEN